MFPQLSVNVITRRAFNLDSYYVVFSVEQPEHLTRGPKHMEVVASVRRDST
jgi:hypothetical protein